MSASCFSTPFRSTRSIRFVTGTIAAAARNSDGFRNTDSIAIIPPWLHPMMPIRWQSTSE
jgi:hypothetical protein